MKKAFETLTRHPAAALAAFLLIAFGHATVPPQPHYGTRLQEPVTYDKTIEVTVGGTALQQALDLADSDTHLGGGFSTKIIIASGTHETNATKLDWTAASRPTPLCIEGPPDGSAVLTPGGAQYYALKLDQKDNVVIRNLTFTNAPLPTDVNKPRRAYCFGTSKYAFDRTPAVRSADWFIENCHFDNNDAQGAALHHIDYLTVRNCTFNGNGAGGKASGCFVCVRYSLFENVECSNNGHEGFEPFGIYYTKVIGMQCIGNGETGFRMDHGCKELIIEDGEFTDNGNAGLTFETCIGPVDITRCVISGNRDGVVMSTAHGITLDGCTLDGNTRCAFQIYVRDRTNPDNCVPPNWACTASDYDLDDQVWTNTIPIAWNDGTTVKNSTVVCYGTEAKIYWRNYGDNQQFQRWLDEEFTGENNTYGNPDDSLVFDISPSIYGQPHTYTDLAGWQARTGSDLSSTWSVSGTAVDRDRPQSRAARAFTGRTAHAFSAFAMDGSLVERAASRHGLMSTCAGVYILRGAGHRSHSAPMLNLTRQ